MDWLSHWNKALDDLEQHLDGEIDLSELGRLVGCSAYHFQRMFSYLAGVPLSEYIRRRRMTRAAADLQNGERVLDVAHGPFELSHSAAVPECLLHGPVYDSSG